MGNRQRRSQEGVALATALAAAVVVSLLVIAALNLTLRRFELSAARSDHAQAAQAAEAGLRYVFERLRLDDQSDGLDDGAGEQGLEDRIRFDDDSPYVISDDPGPVTIRMDGTDQVIAVDEQPAPPLGLGRPVHIAIQEDANDPNTPPRLRIHADADFGQ